MKCKCGFEAPEGAKFCAECGKKLPKPKPPAAETEQPIIREVDPVLKPNEAAKLLKISRWKLDELRIQGKLPLSCYFEIPSESEVKRIYRYKARDLLAWVGMAERSITKAD
jgi:hypothetical protein